MENVYSYFKAQGLYWKVDGQSYSSYISHFIWSISLKFMGLKFILLTIMALVIHVLSPQYFIKGTYTTLTDILWEDLSLHARHWSSSALIDFGF